MGKCLGEGHSLDWSRVSGRPLPAPGRWMGAEAACVRRFGAPPAVVQSAKPSPPGGVRCVRGPAGGGKQLGAPKLELRS